MTHRFGSGFGAKLFGLPETACHLNTRHDQCADRRKPTGLTRLTGFLETERDCLNRNNSAEKILLIPESLYWPVPFTTTTPTSAALRLDWPRNPQGMVV